MNEFVKLGLTVVVVGTLFAFLWRKGYLLKISDYVAETREELRKCTWPTVEELKGSTVAVIMTTFLLGVFTVLIDFVIVKLVRLIT
jgi:preprotein translocase subunit SecE